MVGQPDTPIWSPNPTGKFSLKSFYSYDQKGRFAEQGVNNQTFWKKSLEIETS